MSGATESAPTRKGGGGARAAWLVGAGIFLSRVAGVVREMVFSFYFGNSAVADAWGAALRTPNVIQNLLGEGTLSASFVPVYARFLEEGREEEAGRFAGAALGIVSVVAFGAGLLGLLLAPWIVETLYPLWTEEKQALTVRLIRILFPMAAVLAVSAWALGILNSHRRFFVSYVAPVLWNLAMVTALVTFGTVLGWNAQGRDADLAAALALGALAGGALQFAVMLPWVVPVLRHFRLSVSRRVAGVRDALRAFIPVVAARGVVNVSGLLDIVLAGLLVDGAVSMLRYGQTLYLLPISLFAMSIAASELPELSRSGAGNLEAAGDRVRRALERISFLLIPSALAYLTLGDVFVAALLERGEFDRPDTVAVYAVLGAYTLGIARSSRSRVLSSAFYALRDTGTPARVAYLRVAASLAIGVALMFPLDRVEVDGLRLGAVGLALGASAGAWLESVLLHRRLNRALGPHRPGAGRVRRITTAALAAAALGITAKATLGSVLPARSGLAAQLLGPESPFTWPLVAAGTATVFGVSYLAITSALGVGVPLSKVLRRSEPS
ncbi:MAG: murein biosynthesis integral membrane protein MurJ [Gemmatimonadota bacterium]|nr:murein biosynthesis integral membrane protein MurJ [Gemmatimonadota bacterium]